MGRRHRKRSYSDVDDSLEACYSANRGGSQESAKSEDHDEKRARTEQLDKGKEDSTTKSPEDDKVAALRKKKEERKAKKKAKIAKRKEEAEMQNKLRQQQEQEKKRKQTEKLEQKKRLEEKIKSQKFTFTRMGVKYQDVIVGKGPLVKDRKKVRVSYVLRAKHRHGKVLDSSEDFGFRLGRGEVIEGWDIGVQGMRQGGKRYLIVPPNAGYGNKNIGAGPGGLLFFEVTVIAC